MSLKNCLVISSRSTAAVVLEPARVPVISSEALELVPGQGIYAWEARWKQVWAERGQRPLRSADAAFLGWVRKQV